jgi:acetylornithine deacetylase/succinyl-diaminopimelate desuccinylase-like protein
MPTARWTRLGAGSIKAFLELHIEQGPVLERAEIPIGIANGISGVCFLQVRYDGIANHSGTTPMDMRADAFAGLAAFANTIPATIDGFGTEQSRITIGKVELQPNFAHTIPGAAEFSIILRDTSEDGHAPVARSGYRQCRDDGESARAAMRIEEKSWLAPVTLDAELHACCWRRPAARYSRPSTCRRAPVTTRRRCSRSARPD